MADPTTPMKQCPRCKTITHLGATFCVRCGRQFQTTAGAAPPPLPPVPVPSRTDLCAVLSFACGLVGFWLLAIVFGPVGLVLAIVSLYRTGEQPSLKGRALAVVGLLFGIASTGYAAWQIYREQHPITQASQAAEWLPVVEALAAPGAGAVDVPDATLRYPEPLRCGHRVAREWTAGAPRSHYLRCMSSCWLVNRGTVDSPQWEILERRRYGP